MFLVDILYLFDLLPTEKSGSDSLIYTGLRSHKGGMSLSTGLSVA